MRHNEGQGEIAMQSIDMRGLVKEMTGLLEASVSRRAVLKFDLPSEPVLFEGDPTRVRLIIMNLVKNVTDTATGSATLIKLAVGVKSCGPSYFKKQLLKEELPEGDYVFFEVSNKSVGISTTVGGRDSDFSSAKKLEGIPSMAIVKGIIQSHRGTITLEEISDKGAAIRVLFPALEVNTGKIEKEPARPEEARNNGSDTVLLVDDEEMVLRVAKAMLERNGLHVVTASDGKEALETFQECSDAFQCVILNMTMPRMGGEKCFHELVRINPSVNVIVVSGYTEEQVLPLFTDVIPAGFIQKPYNLNEFPGKVKAVVNGGRMPALLN